MYTIVSSESPCGFFILVCINFNAVFTNEKKLYVGIGSAKCELKIDVVKLLLPILWKTLISH